MLNHIVVLLLLIAYFCSSLLNIRLSLLNPCLCGCTWHTHIRVDRVSGGGEKIQTTICSPRFPSNFTTRDGGPSIFHRPRPNSPGNRVHLSSRPKKYLSRNSFYTGNRNSTLFANVTIYIVPDENWQSSLVFADEVLFNRIQYYR